MGRSGGGAARPIPDPVALPAIIGDDAIAELIELLDYIRAESPAAAEQVAERIIREVDRIGRSPEIRPEDPDAPAVPGQGRSRKVTVSGYTIRYVYPFIMRGRARVLIVSIQRGVRVLDRPEYVLRWLEERAKLRKS